MRLVKHIVWGAAAWLFVAPFGTFASSTPPADAGGAETITTGKKVTLEVTLKLADQSVVFSNVGSQPLTITQGDQQVVRGLEQALEGMHVGEHKQVTVQPSEGFGVVLSQNFREVPKDKIPPDLLEVGTELKGDGPHGHTVFFRIAEVKEQTVVLDFNHPLAGKILHFDVTVLGIE